MLRWGKKVKVGVVYGGIEYTYIEWGGGSCLQYIYIYIYRRGKELDDDWKEVGWYFFFLKKGGTMDWAREGDIFLYLHSTP